ncbi:MAG: MBL fold metallo-hydrolase [bacterium]|nr:MBL fold metallo-hydrolase [bacterium]
MQELMAWCNRSLIPRLVRLAAVLALLAAGAGATAPAAAETGFFQLRVVDGRWWFVDPQGEQFISVGINHLEPVMLTAAVDLERSLAKYGPDLIDADGNVDLRGAAARAFMDESLERIISWGFNSLGVHNHVPQKRLPYVTHFRPVPLDGWLRKTRHYPDPFSTTTKRQVESRAQDWAGTRRDDRSILGVSFTDMPVWRLRPGRDHPWVATLKGLPASAPGKQAWIGVLRRRYPNPTAAARAHGVEAETWEALAAITDWPRHGGRPASRRRDQEAFLPRIADRWYSLLSTSVRRHAPHHLILGDKIMPDKDLPEWLVPIIGRHFDVLYFQWYATAEDQIPRLRELHRVTGKPILLGDSSFSHPNERVPNPKGVRVGSQEEVGVAYERYLQAILSEPYVLGWHYCGFMEGAADLARRHPLFARQNGLMRPDGTVYTSTVERVTRANGRAFAWHAAAPPLVEPSASTTAPPTSSPAADEGAVKASRCVTTRTEDGVLTRIDHNVFELRVRRESKKVPNKPISWILTGDGVLVFDTGSIAGAKVAKRLIHQMTDEPIRYIIYSHHHGTQVRGASVLKEADTQIIAHEDLVSAFDLIDRLPNHFRRLNSIQFDLEGSARTPTFLYPDRTYRLRETLHLGTVEIELYHVVGEADDYTIAWLPGQRIVFVADLVGAGMPMVASPMKPVRNEVKWRQALAFIQSLSPEIMLHSTGIHCDPETVSQHLDTTQAFLAFLHDAVTRELDAGSSVEEALDNVRLPSDLAASPYLRQGYGSLEYAVRGLYHRYLGWFDRNATHLRPAPRALRARSFLEAMGGTDRVLAKAERLAAQGDYPLALEYLDLLIDAGPDRRAHLLKATVLDALAEIKTPNRLLRNMYRRLAIIERRKAGEIAE